MWEESTGKPGMHGMPLHPIYKQSLDFFFSLQPLPCGPHKLPDHHGKGDGNRWLPLPQERELG